jgi:Divergent InlB B-repeat domain/Glucodextranase, domain B
MQTNFDAYFGTGGCVIVDSKARGYLRFGTLFWLTVILSALLVACPNLLDSTPPNITITSPANNSSVNTASVTVTGVSSDDIAVTGVQYSLNGGTRQNASGSTTWTFNLSLITGSNTIVVYATDAAGNEGNASLSLTFTSSLTNNKEAEAPDNSLSGGAFAWDCAPCSNGKNVGYLGKGGAVQFNNLAVPSNGLYTLKIFYLNGDKTNRDFKISVNGLPAVTQVFSPTGGWLVVGTLNLPVMLNAGTANTILFSNPSAFGPDLDKIELQGEQAFDLNITKTGTGTGSISSNPTGIDCGATCNANFSSGKSVTLSALPTTGSSFVGWGGACTGTTTCTVTMDAAKAVTATFEATSGDVPLGNTPTISGKITNWSLAPITTGSFQFVTSTQNPVVIATGNINTLGEFAATLSIPPAVALTAFSSGAASGCTSGSTATYSNGFKSVILQSQVLTQTGTKVGNAAISNSPTVQNSSTLPIGTKVATLIYVDTDVTLNGNCNTSNGQTQRTNNVKLFAGWNYITYTQMTSTELTLEAGISLAGDMKWYFLAPTTSFTLNITKAGTGTGSISSNPSGIDCGATCSTNFNSGTPVTLTATPAAGSSFAGWSGACTGTTTCTVTMDTAKTVTATFNRNPVSSFDLASAYPQNSSTYTIAPNANALYFVNITNRSNFTLQAQNFDALEFTGSILGTGTNQVQVVFRKDLSSADALAFVLVGGASVPVGEYTVTVVARGGGIASSAATVKILVTPCSSGC